ncbi:MAG: hypothetical protein ACO1OF_11320 [Adhaeribacter sp.]
MLKEELPEERESRYWAFLLGVGAYAILLLLLYVLKISVSIIN